MGYAGLTSIMAIKLAIQINKRFGVTLDSKSLAKTGTIQSIENEILTKILSGEVGKTEVAEEVHARPVGFIEELEATLKVVSNSWVSLAFYVILFCFLAFLELFVLTIKMGETKCDYELIVENQLNLKKSLMDQTSQSLIVNKAA